jgi:hypothetical protein
MATPPRHDRHPPRSPQGIKPSSGPTIRCAARRTKSTGFGRDEKENRKNFCDFSEGKRSNQIAAEKSGVGKERVS